jgi:hypothetical protein
MAKSCDGAVLAGGHRRPGAAVKTVWARSGRDGQRHLFGRRRSRWLRAVCGYGAPRADLQPGDSGPRCWACLLVEGGRSDRGERQEGGCRVPVAAGRSRALVSPPLG